MFLNEHADLSKDMAMRIEKAFGVCMDTLMKMQSSYNFAQARMREDEIKVQPYVSVEPVGLTYPLHPNGITFVDSLLPSELMPVMRLNMDGSIDKTSAI